MIHKEPFALRRVKCKRGVQVDTIDILILLYIIYSWICLRFSKQQLIDIGSCPSIGDHHVHHGELGVLDLWVRLFRPRILAGNSVLSNSTREMRLKRFGLPRGRPFFDIEVALRRLEAKARVNNEARVR